MSPPAFENVLVIGDADRQVQDALAQALPNANVTAVASVFDGIAEMASNRYTAVLASAEPIERRPESAVKTLRSLAAESRLVLFGQSSLEPVSRKMLSFGLDDYIVTPATPGELSQIFGQPSLRVAATQMEGDDAGNGLAAAETTKVSLLSGLPMADIVLDAMLSHPQGGPAAAVKQINARLSPSMQLQFVKSGGEAPIPPDGSVALAHAVRGNGENVATLHFILPRDEEESAARHFLAQLALTIGKIATLEDRHVRLQKLAITDDLTGLYNARYFRHFLTAIIQKAHAMRFPVTLMLFDLDGFKVYNDQFGHGVGDEILRQTAGIIRRCVRDHDVVARLGGDEFAVVLWEKEGPRQPREGAAAAVPSSRIPQTPTQIFQRIQRFVSSPDFSNLGSTGKGQLSISAGMAVYPYDAQDVNGLIEVADRELMFGAKQAGKNCLKIVGRDAEGPEIDPTP